MIPHENYVNFEQAVQLKKLGYNWESFTCFLHTYEGEDGWRFKLFNRLNNYNDPKDNTCISAPTLSQVQKWLREVKGIIILITHYHFGYSFSYEIKLKSDNRVITGKRDYVTYEHALLAGIDKAFLILKHEII